MNKNKGFTLIELLVVIAIIGILSSVVLASLSNARDKGRDAAVKSQLASMKAQSELYYSKNETYYNSETDNLCDSDQDDSDLADLLEATQKSAGSAERVVINGVGVGTDLNPEKYEVRCNVSATPADDRWAVEAPLSEDGHYYCADNTGLSKEVTTPLAVDAYVCPEI